MLRGEISLGYHVFNATYLHGADRLVPLDLLRSSLDHLRVARMLAISLTEAHRVGAELMIPSPEVLGSARGWLLANPLPNDRGAPPRRRSLHGARPTGQLPEGYPQSMLSQ
jgi:hypothetical protein